MLKILSAKQIRELDQFTIEHEPIAPIDLMERACHAFAQWFVQNVRQKESRKESGHRKQRCRRLGIARMLQERGYSVRVWIVRGEME
ncbi:MAG: hypothetical protein QM734_17350 [Cyclobacteriaceae bacterium]